MNKKPLNEFSDEELLQTKKTIAVITIILTSMLILLLGMGIYISIIKKFSALVAIPFALSPIVIMNFKRLKDVNQQLKVRGKS